MVEYIKKDEVIKLIREDKVEITPKLLTIATFASPNGYSAEVCYKALNDTCDRHIKEITNLPAADVQPVVHGWWIPVTNGRGGNECNQCHAYAPSYQNGSEYKSKYCPDCGAKMDGKN